MFKNDKVKKPRKTYFKDQIEESVTNCKSDNNSDIIVPIIKTKKKKKQLKSIDEDTTVEFDGNTASVPPSSIVESKKNLKRKRNQTEIEEGAVDSFKDSIKDTSKQKEDATVKMSKKRKKVNTANDDINREDENKVVTVKEELPVDTSSSLKMKAKRKKKKKKSGGNETIINESEYKELDEFIGELDEESNAQYDSWINQLEGVFKNSV